MCDLNYGSIPDWCLLVTGIISLIYLKRYVDDTSKIRSLNESQLHLSEKNSLEQGFDDKFFNLLNAYYSLISNLRMEIEDKTYIGKDCLSQLSNNLLVELDTNLNPKNLNPGETVEDYRLRINTIYLTFYKGHASVLSHYFRFLFNFFRFIDEAKIEDKMKYINLLKANLSEFEFELLYFNGITDHGNKFKLYINNYGLFENWIRDLALAKETKDFKELYNKSAFGE